LRPARRRGLIAGVPSEAEESDLTEAERRGDPYLIYRDSDGRQRVLSLPDSWSAVTIGRSLSADVVLSWDEDVSRIHTELRRMGVEWVLVDEGLSRNGSFVNGERVEGRRLLDDGDELRFGRTLLRYRAPFQVSDQTRAATAPDLGGG
jgi:pSer/pThr/pTyr-binding forkhead associated (FHA) protein